MQSKGATLVFQNIFKVYFSLSFMDYGFSEKRNKRKVKLRDKKKHPYRSGGKYRSTEIEKKG